MIQYFGCYKVCNTTEALNDEISRIKKLLVNNNFPNKLIDKTIQNFKDKFHHNNQTHGNQVIQSVPGNLVVEAVLCLPQ